jgi:hypothetical protein
MSFYEENPMSYFADASEDTRERRCSIPRTLKVTDTDDSQVVIGTAQEVGQTEKGESIWSLTIGDEKVSGLFVLVAGEFVQLGASRRGRSG